MARESKGLDGAGFSVDLHLKLLGWITDNRQWIVSGVFVGLTTFLGLDLLAQRWPDIIPILVARESDLSGTFTVAAGFESLVAVVAGCVALLVASVQWQLMRVAWALAGTGCIAYGVFDFFLNQPSGNTYMAMIASGFLLASLMVVCLRRVPGGLRFLALACVLALSNPVTAAYENELLSDPSMYHFIAPDVPYTMNATAWHRLWLTRRYQEASEVVAMILLLQSFLMAGTIHLSRERSEAAPESGRLLKSRMVMRCVPK